jgi:diguanylate cyclase (GGDEF)-like protein/PAS domain S-box-containing protein
MRVTSGNVARRAASVPRSRSRSPDEEPTENVALGEKSVGSKEDEASPVSSEDLLKRLFECANDMIFFLDLDGIVTLVNPATERLMGFGSGEMVGTNFMGFVAPADRERAGALLARLAAGGDVTSEELGVVAKDGHRVFVEASARPVEVDGQLVGVEGIARDVTERHARQETLVHQALHDPLTGLPNRTLFVDRLAQALARAERRSSRVAVLLLDLNNFKLINDSLGHGVGDEVLVAVARRLGRELRASESAMRLGGDEFAFAVEDVETETELAAVASRILSALAEPLAVDDRVAQVTASLGIALAEPGDDPVSLLRNADIALYQAKAEHRGGFDFFDRKMRARTLRELELGAALKDALQAGELAVRYQPIVSLGNGQVLAVEALARWRHPPWGWVQPTEFIPLAERNGTIIALGMWLFAEAAAQAGAWRKQYPNALPLGVFVNVSPRQLSQPNFVPFLTETLSDHDACPSDIGIEVTEHVFIDAPAQLDENLATLTQTGIRLSLDDFGTGYSALSSLMRFPLAALKIDRSFIRDISRDTDSDAITTAAISLAHGQDLLAIAEGVETEGQAKRLRQLGCAAAQGYYFARPQPASELTGLLETHLPARFPRFRRPAPLSARDTARF